MTDSQEEKRSRTVGLVANIVVVLVSVLSMLGTGASAFWYFARVEQKQAVSDATTTLKIEEIKSLITRLEADRKEKERDFADKIKQQDAEIRLLLIGKSTMMQGR